MTKPKTKLRLWLGDRKILLKDAAKLLGVSRPYMSRIAAGEASPGLPIVAAIERMTEGEVRAGDLGRKPQEEGTGRD